MINALKPHFREFLRGAVVVDEAKQEYLWFKYAILSDKEKQWNTPINNLVSEQDTMLIRTSWDLPFKVDDKVLLNGVPYLIRRCSRKLSDINEQSLGLLKSSFSAYWEIEVSAV